MTSVSQASVAVCWARNRARFPRAILPGQPDHKCALCLPWTALGTEQARQPPCSSAVWDCTAPPSRGAPSPSRQTLSPSGLELAHPQPETRTTCSRN